MCQLIRNEDNLQILVFGLIQKTLLTP